MVKLESHLAVNHVLPVRTGPGELMLIEIATDHVGSMVTVYAFLRPCSLNVEMLVDLRLK